MPGNPLYVSLLIVYFTWFILLVVGDDAVYSTTLMTFIPKIRKWFYLNITTISLGLNNNRFYCSFANFIVRSVYWYHYIIVRLNLFLYFSSVNIFDIHFFLEWKWQIFNTPTFLRQVVSTTCVWTAGRFPCRPPVTARPGRRSSQPSMSSSAVRRRSCAAEACVKGLPSAPTPGTLTAACKYQAMYYSTLF